MEPPTPSASQVGRTPAPGRLAWALLGAMTLFTFGGPVAIGLALAGGPSPAWPPDRPAEWAVFGFTSAAVLALMTACVALALANLRKLKGSAAPGPRP